MRPIWAYKALTCGVRTVFIYGVFEETHIECSGSSVATTEMLKFKDPGKSIATMCLLKFIGQVMLIMYIYTREDMSVARVLYLYF